MRTMGRIFLGAVMSLAMLIFDAHDGTVAAPYRAPVGLEIVSRPLERGVAAASAPDRAVARQDAIAQMQAALRIASRDCDADQHYARLLIVHHAAFDDAALALDADYRRRFGGRAEAIHADDVARTERVFARAEARPAFCRAAAQAGAEAVRLDAAGLAAFAPLALARLERPFFALGKPRRDAEPKVVAKPRPVIKPAAVPKESERAAKAEDKPDIGPTGYVVQLGAVDSSRAAKAAWNGAVRLHEELGGRALVQTRARSGGRVIYRVAAGGFDTRSEAAGLCDILKAKGAACFVRIAAKA